jgi:hypothetical protein
MVVFNDSQFQVVIFVASDVCVFWCSVICGWFCVYMGSAFFFGRFIAQK